MICNVAKLQDRLINENALTKVFIKAQLINKTMWSSPRQMKCPDGLGRWILQLKAGSSQMIVFKSLHQHEPNPVLAGQYHPTFFLFAVNLKSIPVIMLVAENIRRMFRFLIKPSFFNALETITPS